MMPLVYFFPWKENYSLQKKPVFPILKSETNTKNKTLSCVVNHFSFSQIDKIKTYLNKQTKPSRESKSLWILMEEEVLNIAN